MLETATISEAIHQRQTVRENQLSIKIDN